MYAASSPYKILISPFRTARALPISVRVRPAALLVLAAALFLAAIFVPLALAIWMLMAATAKLLSLLMGGRASFEQYLVITAFSFFPFWILAGIIDTIFSGVIDGCVLQALTGQLGALATGFWSSFPQFFYTFLYGLGGVWIGICAAGVESFKWWKAIPAAMFAFAWPMLLMSVLVR